MLPGPQNPPGPQSPGATAPRLLSRTRDSQHVLCGGVPDTWAADGSRAAQQEACGRRATRLHPSLRPPPGLASPPRGPRPSPGARFSGALVPGARQAGALQHQIVSVRTAVWPCAHTRRSTCSRWLRATAGDALASNRSGRPTLTPHHTTPHRAAAEKTASAPAHGRAVGRPGGPGTAPRGGRSKLLWETWTRGLTETQPCPRRRPPCWVSGVCRQYLFQNV